MPYFYHIVARDMYHSHRRAILTISKFSGLNLELCAYRLGK